MKLFNSFFLLATFLFLFSCSNNNSQNIEIKGNAMGTFYFIKMIDVPNKLEKDKLKLELNKTFLEINKIVSNWDKLSEISILNNNKTLAPVNISDNLLDVFYTANIIHLKSNGFFDITLDPLIELWGFGYKEEKIKNRPPSQKDI